MSDPIEKMYVPDGPEDGKGPRTKMVTIPRAEYEAYWAAAKLMLRIPAHGVCGGPLVGARLLYEDGTDENTARHKGWLDHAEINACQAALRSAGIHETEGGES